MRLRQTREKNRLFRSQTIRILLEPIFGQLLRRVTMAQVQFDGAAFQQEVQIACVGTQGADHQVASTLVCPLPSGYLNQKDMGSNNSGVEANNRLELVPDRLKRLRCLLWSLQHQVHSVHHQADILGPCCLQFGQDGHGALLILTFVTP